MNIDRLIQEFYEEIIKEHQILWNDFPDNISNRHKYYYAEDGLYLIKDKRLGDIYFMEARSPIQAFEKWLKERIEMIKEIEE